MIRECFLMNILIFKIFLLVIRKQENVFFKFHGVEGSITALSDDSTCWIRLICPLINVFFLLVIPPERAVTDSATIIKV